METAHWHNGRIDHKQKLFMGPVVYGQAHTYVDAIIRAGGLPVILPISNEIDVLDALSEQIDGLLLSGGNDIDPKLYGHLPHKATQKLLI